jgi:hypothetical protein
MGMIATALLYKTLSVSNEALVKTQQELMESQTALLESYDTILELKKEKRNSISMELRGPSSDEEAELQGKTADKENEYKPNKPKGGGGLSMATADQKSGRPTGKVPTSLKPEEYKVVLGADPKIKMPGIPGELRVWIGSPTIDPNLPTYLTRATGSLPAIGETAKVTPFAPAFDVEPKESICMGIDPTGSAVRFRLRPTKAGTFNVGADVQLFYSDNCSGTPVPKSTETLQVEVVVDTDEAFQARSNQLGQIFWEKFVDFWGVLVALFFGLVLFLIRGRLKKWFAFWER